MKQIYRIVPLAAALVIAGCGNDSGGQGVDATAGDDSSAALDAAADASVSSDTQGSGDTGAPADTSAAADGSKADSAAPADTTGAGDTGATSDAAGDTGGGDAGGGSCSTWKAAYQGMIGDALAKHLTCKVKSDCVLVQTSTACSGTCGQAINKAGKAEVEAAVAKADKEICKANDYGGKCGYSTPSCAQPDPSCEDGKCVYMPKVVVGPCKGAQPAGTECVDGSWVCKKGWFKPAPESKSCMEATCQNMASALGELIGGTVATVNMCKVDSDCEVVPTTTKCQGTCGAAVNKVEKQVLLDRLAWADANICEKHTYAKQCGYATPKCMAPAPGCKGGVCVYNKKSAP